VMRHPLRYSATISLMATSSPGSKIFIFLFYHTTAKIRGYKMKKVVLAALLVAAGSVFAADYSSMSTEELKAMRGSVPAEERAAFQSEMQKRASTMSAEERASMQKSKSGPADGTGMKKGGGGGMGGGQGMGRNR